MQSFTYLACIAGLILVPAIPAIGAQGDVATSCTAPTVAVPSLVIDHEDVASAAAMPQPRLLLARTHSVVLGHPHDGSLIGRDLGRLATAEPERFAVRSANWPSAAWLAKGGVGTYLVGKTTGVQERVADFERRLASLGDDPGRIVALQLAAQDLAPGRTVEIGYRTFAVTVEATITSVSLASTTVENLRARRVYTNGAGAAVDQYFNYPLELPTIDIRQIRTQAQVPAGSRMDNVAGFGPDVLIGKGTEVRPGLSDRDPRLAFAAYVQGMERIAQAHPRTTVVWTTVPLLAKDNYQRNVYNQWVRAYARDKRKPLFDLADMMSHDAQGVAAMDQQGPTLAPVDTAGSTGSSDTAAGAAAEARIARAWWVLLARLDGWDGKGG